MNLCVVVAMANNGVIGRDGGLPWRLSTDLKRFKALTIGSPVIMGRKTWDSIGRPLPGRRNLVVSRDPAASAVGAEFFTSLEEAIAAAAKSDADNLYVIGGGQIYADAFDRFDRLHVTHVEAETEGDTVFPAIDPVIWQAIHEETFPAGEKDDHPTRYVVYERR